MPDKLNFVYRSKFKPRYSAGLFAYLCMVMYEIILADEKKRTYALSETCREKNRVSQGFM